MENTIGAAADLLMVLDEHRIATYVSRLDIGRMCEGSWLHDLPFAILAALPKIKRIGCTLRDQSGRVIAFLQETGVLQKCTENCAQGGIILNANKMARDTGLNLFHTTLSTLGLVSGATLAATVIGVGINVAGFAMVLNRLNRVELIAKETKRDAVAARLAAERVDVVTAIRNKSETRAYLLRAEEAWSFSDPASIWKEIQTPLVKQLTFEQSMLGQGGTNSIFLDEHFTFDEAVGSYESVLLIDAARFQTLLLTEEKLAALANAERTLTWHRTCVSSLSPAEIARARSKGRDEGGTGTEADKRLAILRRAAELKEHVFEIERHLISRIELIRYLIERGISGRAYVEEARQNANSPLMILPVT